MTHLSWQAVLLISLSTAVLSLLIHDLWDHPMAKRNRRVGKPDPNVFRPSPK